MHTQQIEGSNRTPMQKKAATAAAAAAVVVLLLCGPQLHPIRGEGKEEEWWGYTS